MAETSVMTALRTGTEDRQYAKNSDAQIAMALQALALRQKQEAGREQEQAQQQKMQGAKYLADKQMASVPPPPPPQAMAPGQPSVPMQPPQQGGVPPPPMGGSMMAQPQPQQAPAVPPQQPTPWMTSRAAPPSLGGQPPAPTASSEVGNPPTAPNTGVDMPKIRDPKEIFKTIESTPELANLPLYEKGQLADAMAETMSKQNKAVVEKWKIEQEVEDAKRRAGKQAEEDSLVKLFGHKPSAEELKLFFVTGDMAKAKALGLQQEQKKAAPAASAITDSGIPPQDQDKTGDAFLATLPPSTAKEVKAIAEGRQNISAMGYRGAQRQQMLERVNQYDPNFDQTQWAARSSTQRDFASGQAAKNITAINTAIGHLGTFDELATALKNNDVKLANKLVNRVAEETGQPQVSNLELAQVAISDELMRTFRQVGASDAEADRWEKAFTSSKSPEQFKGAVQTAVKLLSSRAEALQDQWTNTMGDVVPKKEVIHPTSKAVLDKMGVKMRGFDDTPSDKPSASTAGKKTVTTKAERDALPVGTRYLDKDGNEWVRH